MVSLSEMDSMVKVVQRVSGNNHPYIIDPVYKTCMLVGVDNRLTEKQTGPFWFTFIKKGSDILYRSGVVAFKNYGIEFLTEEAAILDKSDNETYQLFTIKARSMDEMNYHQLIETINLLSL